MNRIRSKLESDIETRRKLSNQYKRFYNALHGVAVGSTGVNAAVAGASLAFLANPITLTPLVAVNVSSAGVGAITGVWSRVCS